MRCFWDPVIMGVRTQRALENSRLKSDMWQLAVSRWHLKLEWTQVDLFQFAYQCFKKRRLCAFRWRTRTLISRLPLSFALPQFMLHSQMIPVSPLSSSKWRTWSYHSLMHGCVSKSVHRNVWRMNDFRNRQQNVLNTDKRKIKSLEYIGGLQSEPKKEMFS